MRHAPAASERKLHDIAETGLLAYCRPGFEGECAQELARDAAGFVRAERGRGFVELVGEAPAHATWRGLVFARQLLGVLGRAEAMSRTDRLASLLPIIEATAQRWCDAWVEAPDSDEGRELASLCRALNAALVTALKKKRLLDPASRLRLHVCLTAPDAAIVGYADITTSAPWPGGIPRLRFPHGAPSRSTLASASDG